MPSSHSPTHIHASGAGSLLPFGAPAPKPQQQLQQRSSSSNGLASMSSGGVQGDGEEVPALLLSSLADTRMRKLPMACLPKVGPEWC